MEHLFGWNLNSLTTASQQNSGIQPWFQGIANLFTPQSPVRTPLSYILPTIKKIEVAKKGKRVTPVELFKQDQVLLQKNKDMVASLNYARTLQQTMVYKKGNIEKHLPVSFLFDMPIDVVGGDFVRVEEVRGKTLVVLADCTGHGVPGAMMSMAGSALLTEIVSYNQVLSPSNVLELLDEGFKEMTKDDETVNDGMDIAFCSIDKDTMRLTFAGARRPLYLIRNDELIEVSGERCSIGGNFSDRKEFIAHEIEIQKGDRIYLFSDGVTDQFGGQHSKRLTSKKWKKMLLDVQHLNMDTQKETLKDSILAWKGDNVQVDDICVLGFEI